MSARHELAFVRAVQKFGSAQLQEDGTYLVSQSMRPARQAISICRKLVAQGVLQKTSGALVPTAETVSWVRRQLAIGPDKFATQHRLIVEDMDQRQINLNESPLAKLAARSGDKNPLMAHHLAAGERFRLLFERAAIRQRITMSYDPERIADSGNNGSPGCGLTGMSMDARREIDAVYAILPEDCAGVIMDVCGFEKGLQQVEVERGWPRRSAKLVLRIGLEQLALHFGLAPVATGLKSKPISGWRHQNARPTEVR